VEVEPGDLEYGSMEEGRKKPVNHREGKEGAALSCLRLNPVASFQRACNARCLFPKPVNLSLAFFYFFDPAALFDTAYSLD
jgi:hypothetical protein